MTEAFTGNCFYFKFEEYTLVTVFISAVFSKLLTVLFPLNGVKALLWGQMVLGVESNSGMRESCLFCTSLECRGCMLLASITSTYWSIQNLVLSGWVTFTDWITLEHWRQQDLLGSAFLLGVICVLKANLFFIPDCLEISWIWWLSCLRKIQN